MTAKENLRNRVKQKKELISKIELRETNPAVRNQRVKQELRNSQQIYLQQSKEKLRSTYLTFDAIRKAEHVLIEYVQRGSFSEELEILSAKRCLKLKKSSPLYRLDPFVKDGLIRVGGRIQRADIPYDAKHPILLPKESRVSRLLLENIHRSLGHVGKNAILAKLREHYWVIGAAAIIKSMLSKCVVCRRYQTPVNQQKMADLPSNRLIPDDPPFTRTGMDFFGPFLVKRGRSVFKRYGVVFTCLTIRAVHLEVVSSLDTDSCINAIRRFVSRRGSVKEILSDNGTNMVGANHEFMREIQNWNLSQVHQVCMQYGISWKFNPPAASHFGGVWERQIRSVRKILYGLMHEQTIKLDDEGLQTLFCEVEAIINGRPLTETPNTPDDLKVLTPNHLLLLQPGESFPPGVFDQSDLYARRRWKQIQYLSNLFWSRWTKEYLPLLQKRQKWMYPKRNIVVGDIVLMTDNTPRNSWSLGRVLETIKDKNGLVRIAKVKTKTTVLSRPIAKLCLLLEGNLDD